MPQRWLVVAATVETATLVLLLANLATVHVPSVASALGPVHGFCYLVVIALAWQLPAPTRVRALSLVPAVGGLLVVRAAPAR
ncbi:DUF3817 domain-containing protein [Blastococcus xanthinilyticus]|uniref:Integral membrane protein n=1 Tax=Blastococcus xanthinilyticus TaxID=1564164 RepID=A0A5S5D2R8_9ACTN|nr:DUF3817 domain-containing protein [Blastococcus xanthinilyticus]TYP89092.1 hypothetical protein BD833_103249 [Blastococcus xanthinilyticus]